MKNKTVDQKITDTLKDNYMPYAMSVIISRAIPEIDGFKPSHRKLLYTMYKMNLLGGARTKSANVVGQTMKLNPHGDMAIYETMVRLTRGNCALLHPFVDSKGNFGRQYSRDMAFAAPRYTEVRLDALCAEIFKDIDKDVVDFIDNYDGTMREPLLLPTAFPNVIVNPNQGIAVSMAANLCSFNLREVCAATVKYLKNPNIDLVKELSAPDFSTGGQLIYNENEMRGIYETGRGSFKVRARYRVDKRENCIEVYEIPYTTTCEAIIDKIIDLIKQGKIKEISDLRDETDLSGLKITLDLKRGVDPDMLMTRLFKLTPLEESFSCNFNLLIKDMPRVLGVREVLKEWCDFRIQCVTRRLGFDIARKGEKLHLLEGLKKILLDIDKAIRIIRETKEDALVIPNLMDGFGIDRIQAEFVAEIKLRSLNQEYILKRVNEADSLAKDIAELKRIESDPAEIRGIIIAELKEISKKHGMPRRTEIIHAAQISEYNDDHFVEDYNVKIFLTSQGYFKKISLASLRSSGDQKLKEEDSIISQMETTNRAETLLFSNLHSVYKIRLCDINDCKASVLGEYLPNLLDMEEGERIICAVSTADYSGHMLFAFENGKVAKIEMKSYETKTNRKKLANAYHAGSPLCGIFFISEDRDMTAFSSIDKALVFNTAALSVKASRSSQGVQALNSKKGSRMTRVCFLEDSGITDAPYYRTKNIPATGYYLRDQDRVGMEQLTLL